MKKSLLKLMCLFAMLSLGTGLLAQEVTITLNPGWNWIGYPYPETVSIESAFGDFTPVSGDIIKSLDEFSLYEDEDGWFGDVEEIEPGVGYKYFSGRTEAVSVVLSAHALQVSVTTSEPTGITSTGASFGCVVADMGNSAIVVHGLCWGTEQGPIVSNAHTVGFGTGTFAYEVDDLIPGTTYYVRAFALTEKGFVYGNQVSFTAIGGSEDHAYVDLGLPSGTLWATCNIGADAPEAYGDYFSWGETQPKDYYGWENYQYCNGSISTLTKYCSNSSYGYNGFTDNLTTLLPEDDAATANWGSGWRMPTQAEFQELLDNTTVTWTTRNGVNGRLFTASNGNSLFLPAAGGCRWGDDSDGIGNGGNYWSSSLYSVYTFDAWFLGFISEGYALGNDNRSHGQSVRPVRSSGQNPTPMGAINGLFSVSADQQVYFSQGNLQYQASTNTWRFAENQYDFVGDANSNMSSTYSGWIDLFCWGTSGYDHGANCYQPWSTSESYSDYYAYGDYQYNLYDQTGEADWGCNPISNGGNTANQWRTLTNTEWQYVFFTRTTTSGIRYAKANVDNVNGVILLPDDWNESTYSLNSTDSDVASFSTNVITASQWVTLESAGAVFLPAAGFRTWTEVYHAGSYGEYWSASYYDSIGAYDVDFSNGSLNTNQCNRIYGMSVRLVRVAEN